MIGFFSTTYDMASKNSRQLNTFELVEHFLVNALDMNIDGNNYDIVPKIVTTELNIDNFDDKKTTNRSNSYRNLNYRSDKVRIELKEQIIKELLTKKRLDSDENIQLGKGGAMPRSPLVQEKQAYIVIGLPASGKSGISNKIADEFGAIILDSDYAKRKLPEFNSLPFGATLVHEESTEIIFGTEEVNGFKSLLYVASDYDINVVIPKIGNNPKGISDLVDILESLHYGCHLILVDLDRKKATQRALHRFNETQRYVPLGLIFDSYSNNPTITYYTLKRDFAEKFVSFGAISTDVPKGRKPKVLEYQDSNPSKMFL